MRCWWADIRLSDPGELGESGKRTVENSMSEITFGAAVVKQYVLSTNST